MFFEILLILFYILNIKFLKISKGAKYQIYFYDFVDTNPTFWKLQKLERAILAKFLKCKSAWIAVFMLLRRQRIR